MSPQAKGGAGKTRLAKALTDKALRSFKPGPEPYRVPDSKTRGLAARVATDGQITWDCSFRISGTGKVRRISLGRWPEDKSLAEARNRASDLTKAARDGQDLIAKDKEATRLASERVTVGKVIAEYVKRRVTGQLRTAREIERRLYRALEPIMDRAAEDIRRRDIRTLLDEVADRGHVREAEKRRQVISTLFAWALSVDMIETNPISGLPSYGGASLRDRVLDEDEIRLFWEWLPNCGMPGEHADVLRLCLTLGARCGEIGGMYPGEIDVETRIWVLPAERSKNGKPRATPLDGMAWNIIGTRLSSAGDGPMFPSSTGKPLLSSHVGQTLLVRPLPIAKFITHDLRRTVASQMVQMGTSLETVAAVLGHAAGGATVATLRRHYVRTDQLDIKRAALDAWSTRLQDLIRGTAVATQGNVIAIDRSA